MLRETARRRNLGNFPSTTKQLKKLEKMNAKI